MNAVVHVTSGESGIWDYIFDSVRRLASSGEITVVASGDAAQLMIQGRMSSRESELTEIARAGVTFRACRAALAMLQLDQEPLIDGVMLVDDGLAEALRLQASGYGYVHFSA